MTNDNLPFSVDTLKEQCGGNKDVIAVVLDEFLIQAPTDTSEMDAGLTAGDLVKAGKAAHRLKGSAGVLGATALFTLCLELEMACKENNLETSKKTLTELKLEAGRCVDAVPVALATLQ